APRLTVWRQEIGCVVVDGIDGLGIDELLDRHHRRALDLHAVEVLIGEHQVVVLAEFVALDEIAALKLLPRLGILRDHADPVAGVRVDHVEPDAGPVMPRIPQRDGTGHEREAQMSPPDRARGHQAALSGRQDCRSRSAAPDVSASAWSASAALLNAASWS